jgi:signal recognition particle GTPase
MAMDDRTIFENLKKAVAQIAKSSLPVNVKTDLIKEMKDVLLDLDESIKTTDKLRKDIASFKTKKKELETAQKDLVWSLGTFKTELPKKRQHYKDALTTANNARGPNSDPAISLIWSNLQSLIANANALPDQLTLDS